MSRAREARAARRAAQFAKFRVTELNLVPLVDTLVSIVFFAIVSQTVGELSQVIPGVNLPSSIVGTAAHDQLTLGISSSTIFLATRWSWGRGRQRLKRRICRTSRW
jgi:biopolymer transport protein ExbD